MPEIKRVTVSPLQIPYQRLLLLQEGYLDEQLQLQNRTDEGVDIVVVTRPEQKKKPKKKKPAKKRRKKRTKGTRKKNGISRNGDADSVRYINPPA